MSRARLYLESFVQAVIAYSLVSYFVEVEFCRTEHSLAGHPFFLWSERAVAAIFTVEYLTRWFFAKRKFLYPVSLMAIVDIMAILPFYIGFLIDMRSLRLIRTLRILRVLKLYRYSAAIRMLLASYRKVKEELYVLATAIALVMFVSGTIVYEAESRVQPERFTTFSDGLWWSMVTMTTVGYGDLYPITLTGRITAAITLLIGLGIFGSFISLVGGAFISAVRDEKRSGEMRISERTAGRIAGLLERTGRPVDEDESNRLIETALDVLILHNAARGDADQGAPQNGSEARV